MKKIVMACTLLLITTLFGGSSTSFAQGYVKPSLAIAGEEKILSRYTVKNNESILIKDLVISVIDTSESSVDSIILYNDENGRPILFSNGKKAKATVVNGKAYFEGLNLTIDFRQRFTLEVRGLIEEISNNDSRKTGVSGSNVQIQVLLENERTKIYNRVNGNRLFLSNTKKSSIFTVVNTEVFIQKVNSPHSPLSLGEKRLLSFRLTSKKEAFLMQVSPIIKSKNIDFKNLKVFCGKNLLGKYNGSIHYEGKTTINIFPKYKIKHNEVCSITAEINSIDPINSFLALSIEINSRNSDGITWKDGRTGLTLQDVKGDSRKTDLTEFFIE